MAAGICVSCFFMVLRLAGHLISVFQVALLFLADFLNSLFNMLWIYNVLINQFGMFVILSKSPFYLIMM